MLYVDFMMGCEYTFENQVNRQICRSLCQVTSLGIGQVSVTWLRSLYKINGTNEVKKRIFKKKPFSTLLFKSYPLIVFQVTLDVAYKENGPEISSEIKNLKKNKLKIVIGVARMDQLSYSVNFGFTHIHYFFFNQLFKVPINYSGYYRMVDVKHLTVPSCV